jgi:signal transduction histidine kinase/CheY-like chemotaxis protein
MKKPVLPPNEPERLSKLRSYEILDTGAEKTFDHITTLAAEVCGTKISLISLVDENRQWFKSRTGTTVEELPRDISFCGHAILGPEIFVIKDAREDERFADNPLVTGEPFVTFYAGVPLIAPNGLILGTLCVIDSSPRELSEAQKKVLESLARHVIDLLELRNKNRELKSLSNQYLDVQKMAKTGGWELSAETGEISWSSEIYSIYGLSFDAKPALKDCVRFYAPHEQERISKLYWDSLQNGGSFNEVFEFRDNHGGDKWIRIIGEAVRGSDNKIIKLKGTFQDISEQKQTELELRKLLESNRFVLDSVGVGMWRTDLVSGKQTWDPTMHQLYGTSPETYVPDLESWTKLLTPESRNIIQQDWLKINAGADSFMNKIEVVTPSGERRFLGSSARVVRNSEGKPVMIFGINWDRTKEAELQKELDLERAKILHQSKLASIGQLAAGVGHEINNPLAVLSTFVTILERAPEEAKRPEFLIKMDHSIDRIARIVKGLRTFARPDSEEVITFDPFLLIKETTGLLKDIYENENTRIQVHNESGPVTMMGNRGRIQQVLVNLLSNAKDASAGKKEPLIDVTLKSEGPEIQISVRDNGRGIPAEIQEKIFDPFFTTKDVNLGTGIGLSIVNTIVKEHNGKIGFSSGDNGSEFRVRFPVSQAVSDVQIPPQKLQESPKLIDCSVLVVDDEKELLEAMEMILGLSIKKVYAATSAEEGLRIVQENKIDLILSDIKMPVKDGFDFLKDVRNSSQKDVKFLFLTGGIDMTPEELSRVKSETSGLVPKPIRFPDLLLKVKELFST